MAKKNYYAVASGRKPGIYTSWPEAKAQIEGFSKARYKGFGTRDEAESWLRNPSLPSPGKKPKVRPQVSQTGRKAEIEIYTDGGALGNPGPGGYGIVIITGDEKMELSGGYRLTTNNRMELMGCIVALQELPIKNRPITLYSDSSYVVNGMNRGWAKSWRRNGWIKSDKKPAVNSDLWARLLDLTEGLDIVFQWVKGHAGNPDNERCDRLAVAAANGRSLQIDTGYE